MDGRQPATPHAARRAFSLIELLVVIAVIAILAAILFPVFGAVRENARQSATMSNMHSVYVAVRQFYDDEGRMPNSLFGYAEVRSGATLPNPLARPALPGDANITPMDQATAFFSVVSPDPNAPNRETSENRGYLYREQVRDYSTFVNSVNPVKNKQAMTAAYWPVSSPLGKGGSINAATGEYTPAAGNLVTWMQTTPGNNGCTVYGDTDFPGDNYVDQPKMFYTMDSMDIGPMINPATGRQATLNGQPVYELHYTPDWTHLLGVNCENEFAQQSGPWDIKAQLKYKNPPSDRTVITYSTHHAAHSGSSTIPVLLWSGTARKVNIRNVSQLPMNYKP